MRFITPILLFLDDDLEKSARYLTNFHLEQGIKNSVQILMCSIFYILGFRNKRLFKYYFSKEKWEDETRFKYFANYPLKKTPKFTFYNSPEARWCRMCTNHYQIVAEYLRCMLDEYAFRWNREHELADMYDFLCTLPFEMAVRHGLKLVTLKNGSKIQLPWKNLPLKFRKKNIILGYRLFYKSLIISPLDAFIGTKRDVPDFLIDKLSEL